ncbi:MAG: phosphatase PAP2 family protein [Elusimicrobia bacterium]|nr:phosphatase PAP2 family protein [Elusimicrobiota bacterium]MDA8243376.1 phosphatase PAP2 family protein [Elusimicrobiota bacterium]
MSASLRSVLLSLSLALLPLRAGAGVFAELSSGRPAAVPELPAALPAATRSAQKPHYLSLDGLDLRAVPAPPADGSYEDREDLRAVLDWQARRTGAQCAAARAEMSHDYETFFGKISPFGSPTPPEVKKFFNNVSKDSVAAHTFLKDAYRRPRPADRDSRVKPCIPNARGLSYPSGHSAMSRLFALILSDLVPSRRAEFLAKADESALLRVIGGAHHPTDTQAGKLLADTLYEALKKEPAFRADLRALKPLLR